MIPTGLTLPSEPDPTNSDALGARVGRQNLGRLEASELVYAGSLTLSSGHRIDLLPDILAEVRKYMPEVKLHMYGDGDDVEKLKNMFAQKNLSSAVSWHGRFTHTELVKQLPANTILLDTIDGNITNRAKSSFRVALAGILGLPVVSSDIGIRPYLIPDEFHSRFFAKPGDAADYAHKITEMVRRPLNERETQSLRAHAQQFTWQTLAAKYAKFIAAK